MLSHLHSGFFFFDEYHLDGAELALLGVQLLLLVAWFLLAVDRHPQLCEHGRLLLLVDGLLELIPDEPLRALVVAAHSAQPLDVGALAVKVAHDEQRDAPGVLGGPVVHSAHQLRVSDDEDVVLGEVLEPVQILAVGRCGLSYGLE